MHIQTTIAALLLSFGFAYAAEQSPCSASRADLASTTSQLRDIKESCGFDTKAYVNATRRLNNFQIPQQDVPQLLLRDQVARAPTSRVVYEADVFFDFLEAYPPDIGFTKLAELIDRINTGFFIERIEVVGSTDPVEASESVARLRADFLRRYFTAAGVDPRRITASIRKPTHEDTPEGRARDRSAGLRVVMLQQPADTPSSDDSGAENEINQLRAEQASLLRQIKATLKRADESRPVHANPDVLRNFDEKRAKLAQLLEEIENKIAQENGPAQPASNATEKPYLAYHERLRRRIEQVGTENFPKRNGASLYGTVKVQFTVGSNGRLKRAKITASSGVPELDRHAIRLLQRLEPFEPFPPEMREAADRIVVDELFSFQH